MRTALYSEEHIGIVGPVTNYASGIQQVPVAFRDVQHFQELAVANNVPDVSKWKEVRRIVGLCMLGNRSVLEAVGWLDEAYSRDTTKMTIIVIGRGFKATACWYVAMSLCIIKAVRVFKRQIISNGNNYWNVTVRFL